MLLFDQLKRNDRTLQLIAAGVLLGMLVLMGGLWWVQIVSSKRHEESLRNQSFRSVRVPALRGKIFDTNGKVLAENRPRYDVNLYFEEIFDQFRFTYTNQVLPQFTNSSGITKIPGSVRDKLVLEARYRTVSNITYSISAAMGQPQILNTNRFFTHMLNYPYMPFPITQNLSDPQVAIYSEKFNGWRGMELEVQPLRTYPNTNTAAHLIGYVRREDQPDADEEIAFKYYLPDYAGKIGMEGLFDSELRGKAGVKSLLVNNVGYRQREEIVSATKPGDNLSLTINLELQRAAEKALAESQANVRGAVVVMDVRNGDVLALVSLPAYDPNAFPNGITHAEWARLNNEKYSYIFNRATYGAYPPGSIYKIITGLACLEAGVMDPNAKLHNPGYYADPKTIGRRSIDDTAPAGDYNFERAFRLSSNTYFIHYGLKAGMAKIIEVSKRFHLGERTGAFPGQEVKAFFPNSPQGWSPGNVANLCIGQEITVTPLQMACMTAAIANGGNLFYPRLVKDLNGAPVTGYPGGQIREKIPFQPSHLKLIQEAMLADVVDPSDEGTGRAAYIPNFRAAGKTGTAEIISKTKKDKVTWFVAYAPFEAPRYAVVVMVESGASGGKTCAPVARKVFTELQRLESTVPALASTDR